MVVFGIALPTSDVGSDITLSHSFFSKKPCGIISDWKFVGDWKGGWEYYVREYLNGIEPPIDNATGKLILITFESCLMIIKVLSISEDHIDIFVFQTDIVEALVDFNVSQKKISAFQDGLFVMVAIIVMMGLMKIQISEIVVSNIQSILKNDFINYVF